MYQHLPSHTLADFVIVYNQSRLDESATLEGDTQLRANTNDKHAQRYHTYLNAIFVHLAVFHEQSLIWLRVNSPIKATFLIS
jgi:hypothetical protein